MIETQMAGSQNKNSNTLEEAMQRSAAHFKEVERWRERRVLDKERV
jgi:hypothetical protein